MKVLLLDNYDSFTYNLVQMLEQAGVIDLSVCKNDEISLEEVAKFDKILLSPGPDIPHTAGITCQLIEKYAPQKSILGICLGHQAIGEVCGARLIRLPQLKHGIQEEVLISDSKALIFKGLPNQIKVGLYHSWAIDSQDLPDNLHITALSQAGTIMAITHQIWRLHGVQFHPESIMTPSGKQIIENWLREK
ncbi:MAG: aminodeoxychorismate/anthranilate synthase component II [Microscillaceae bacterium]|nr:aminodeoxychorismate/anthranilate synthase component II [Microscillaceae bacterium]